MASSIGWIDFSSEHRERVRTVIDLLSAPGVIDELGIGVIRDSFADRMFPGISTIQTRAKYFTLTALLIRAYIDEERPKRKPRSLERYLEEEERRCRIHLMEHHQDGHASLGIIGSSFGTRSDRDVVRRPSSVYWNGLRLFGLVSPPHLSLAEFGRRLSNDPRQFHALLQDSGNERGDDHDAQAGDLRPRVLVPEIDDDYWEELSIELTPRESEFLRHQIVACQPESLIGQILMDDASIEQILHLSGSEDQFGAFADLPFIRQLKSDELRRTVEHARDFWKIMEGAHIRYNCLLQGAGFGTAELQAEFEAEWEEWRERMAEFPGNWDSSFMWSLVSKHGNVKDTTRIFIDGWINATREGASDLTRCDDLVRNQELRNKGNRARLRIGNSEAINDRIGFKTLDYRIGVARQLVRDITESGRPDGGEDA